MEYDFVARAGLSGMNMGQGVAEIDLYAPMSSTTKS